MERKYYWRYNEPGERMAIAISEGARSAAKASQDANLAVGCAASLWAAALRIGHEHVTEMALQATKHAGAAQDAASRAELGMQALTRYIHIIPTQAENHARAAEAILRTVYDHKTLAVKEGEATMTLVRRANGLIEALPDPEDEEDDEC